VCWGRRGGGGRGRGGNQGTAEGERVSRCVFGEKRSRIGNGTTRGEQASRRGALREEVEEEGVGGGSARRTCSSVIPPGKWKSAAPWPTSICTSVESAAPAQSTRSASCSIRR
jgi:hypothetical protein